MASYPPDTPPHHIYTLVLMEVGPDPVWVMKEVRSILLGNVSLAEVRKLVENPPAIIAAGLEEHHARSGFSNLRKAGATVKVVQREGKPPPDWPTLWR